MTGRWAATVALAVAAYRHGGAQSVALLGVVRILPAAAAGPLAAMLLRRLRSRRLLFLAGATRTLAVAGIAVLLYANDGLGGVFVLVAVESLFSTIVRPLQTAALPFLARTPRELTAANLTLTTIESSGMLFGPLVAGIVLSLSQPATALAVTAGAYAVSTLLIRLIPAWETDARTSTAPGLGDVLDGLRAIRGDRRLRLVVGLYSAENLVAGSLNVLVVVAALNLLSLGDSGVGVLNGAIGAGGIAGALAAGAVVARGRIASNLGLGLVLCGAPIALIAAIPRVAPALLLLVVLGTGVAIVDFSAVTLLQRAIADDVLARVFSLLQSLFVGTLGIGALLAPVLVGWLGVRGALLVCGGVLPVLAALQWRPLSVLDSLHAADEEAVDLLRRMPIFAPLPLPALERLARSLEPVDAPAGRVVVEQGAEGDRFYAIRDGSVRVSADGREVAVLGPGDGFGEIALLRDVPRTATVTALEDSRLYAVGRDHFLETVAGTSPAQGAADELVDTRLAELRSSLASV